MYGADYFDTTDLAVMHFGNAQTKIVEECTCTNTNFCFFLFKSFSESLALLQVKADVLQHPGRAKVLFNMMYF